VSLASGDVVAFERTARERVQELVNSGVDNEGLRALLKELEGSSLPGFEVARRAGRIAALLPAGAAAPLATIAAESNREIRSALVEALPPQFQRSVYRAPSSTPIEASSNKEAAESQSQASANGASDPHAEPESEKGADDWRTVLLLGGARETAANAQLLESRGMTPVRVSNLEILEALLEEPICGLVIYGSWWNQFGTAEAVVDFVRAQIAHSNLVFTKIDFRHLEAAETPLAAVIDELDDEVRSRVSCSDGPGLTLPDLTTLEGISNSLRGAWQVQVGVEGIDDTDRQLLAAAVSAFARTKHLSRRNTEENLSIRPIHEGRSGADVLVVRSAAYGLVVVAKLDKLSGLQDELDRARQAIPSTWLTAGELCLYSLRGRGALLQRLLVDLDSPQDGAPSLRERLQHCTAWERGRPGVPKPEVGELLLGIDRLIEKVITLNRPAEDQSDSLGWMDADPLLHLASSDIRWHVGDSGSGFDPTIHLNRAAEILGALEGKRVVHGDLHSGNALMLDTRTPDLIDFALAGSGHPCFDLVRISSAIAYEFLRQLDGETHLCAFFGRLHIDGANESELKAEFPDLVVGVGAEVAVHTLVACRTAALKVVDGGEGEALRQYLAMVYLIAAQSLMIEEFQEGLIRTALAAVGPAL
jgi:Phosphotransferase enzyme family